MDELILDGIAIYAPEGKDLGQAVEAELERFNAWFTAPTADGGAGNSPLIGPEKALLRTYLLARLSGRFSPRAPS